VEWGGWGGGRFLGQSVGTYTTEERTPNAKLGYGHALVDLGSFGLHATTAHRGLLFTQETGGRGMKRAA